MYNTLRSFWWDTTLWVRHLRRQQPIKSLWWKFLEAWEAATPELYNKIQSAYRQQRPLPEEETVSPEVYGTVADVEGVKMKIDPRMSAYQVNKLLCGRHTRHERQLMIPLLEPDDVVMELGGGIGMLSTACSLKIGGDRVHSYEANPTMESLIRKNYELNGVKPHLKMCMLDEKPGSCTFHVSEHFARSSAYQLKDQGETKAYEVPVESLNDEIHRIKPTVLIMDVQGSEGKLLGFADLSNVQKLLVEVHSNVIGISRVNELRRQLRNQGFSEVNRAGQSFLYIREAK